MLDIRFIRENSNLVKEKIALKNADPGLVDHFSELDAKWREAVTKHGELKAQQHQLSKNWAELGDREKEDLKNTKDSIKELEGKIRTLEKERDLVLIQIPNLPSEDTPIGKDEGANKIIRTWGTPPQFDFEPKDHIALGESLGLIDIERASRVSGTRFGYLQGDAVMLEFALLEFAFATLRDESILRSLADQVAPGYSAKPFFPISPPVLIRSDVYERTGRLTPQDKEEKYYIPSDDLYLIGSAEHTLAPYHMDETLEEEALPLRYVGFSTSFRREAGSYGKDTRGILRVHQFDKLEMESFVMPQDAFREQDFFVRIQEYLLQQLGVPHQVVLVATGDMGAPDVRQIDIETWLPGQGRYRETHSADLVGEYQARGLNTRVKTKDGEVLVHMNDATVFAVGRMLIAIFENYQTKEGKIRVPEVLMKYVQKEIIG